MKPRAGRPAPPSILHGRVAELVRASLADLSGPWDVSVQSAGRPWLRIDVVGPTGASWSLSMPMRRAPPGDDLGRAVRAGCLRMAQPLTDPAESHGGRHK
jgi:hypothetical protein